MKYAPPDTNHVDQDAIQCDAYNAAFYELGLRWHWDLQTYQRLAPDGEAMKERIQAYLETEQPHILKAYNSDFLTNAILEAKARCMENRLASGLAKPSAVNWAAFQAAQIGV
jgi:hypothetical protein